MVYQDCNSRVSRCKICHRGTGSLRTTDTKEELPSISKGLSPSAALPQQIVDEGEDVLAVNRVELEIIAHTVTGVAAASTSWPAVEQGNRDSLEVSL